VGKMSIHYPLGTRIARLTSVRVERLLPMRGEVLVAAGDWVEPSDVVARCQVRGPVQVVDVGTALGIPHDRAAKLVLKSVGDKVQSGDVLAESKGMLGGSRRSCTAPVDGQVTALRKGWVLIDSSPSTFELRAQMKGQVTGVIPDLGVIITAVGTLIQGAWGSGGEAEGVLRIAVDRPHKPLLARYLDASCNGTLLVAGRILDRHAVEQAAEAKVRGIIVGSVAAKLVPLLQSVPYPTLITEGFGDLPMSQEVFAVLRNSAGREAMLRTGTETSLSAKRPEVLIPLKVEGELPPEVSGPPSFHVGMLVRGLRAPHFGTTGTVVSLPVLAQVMESGARLAVAEVERLKDGEVVPIPLANLEPLY
jgi:hypothetical protein